MAIKILIRFLLSLALFSAASVSYALSLGGMTVQSALGEPLKAEIRIYDFDAQSRAQLAAQMGSRAAFDSAGLIYAELVNSISLSIEHRGPDSFVVLRTAEPINEVVLDLLIRLTAPSQNVKRSYTVFIDPPFILDEQRVLAGIKNETDVKKNTEGPVSAEGKRETVKSSRAAKSSADELISTEKASDDRNAGVSKESDKPTVRSGASGTIAKGGKDEFDLQSDGVTSVDRQVVVKAGDTLSSIAKKKYISGATLEQMLVGFFRMNRDAFVGENMNRLQVGKVLRVPGKDDLLSIDPTEARDEVLIHAADWSAYRSGLSSAPSKVDRAAPGNSRAQSGVVTRANSASDNAKDQTPKPVVRLSGKSGENSDALDVLNERLIATEKALEEQRKKAEELERIIADLRELRSGRSTASVENGDSSQGDKGLVQGTIMQSRNPTTDSWPERVIETVLARPLLLLIPVVLLLALGVIISRRLKHIEDRDEQIVNMEREFQPSQDSNLPSQVELESGESGVGESDGQGDVIEDADIFLAYGRFSQAEKILLDALTAEPRRLDLLIKLGEVYSRQKQIEAFANVANKVAAITRSSGAYWERIVALGFILDPTDERYAEGRFAASAPRRNQTVDLSSIDLNLGEDPSKDR
ncbi:MAG: type IV pilus assembly protein FimV [Burkholderiales bacterium]